MEVDSEHWGMAPTEAGILTVPLFYLLLFALTAGTILHLFLVVMVVGYRRRRALERLLFLLSLALFLFYAGLLLKYNLEIHYASPPHATLLFAELVTAAGLWLFPPFLFHVHAAHYKSLHTEAAPNWVQPLVVAVYLPLIYFLSVSLPWALANPHLIGWTTVALPLRLYGLWLGGVLLAGASFQRVFARASGDSNQRTFHYALSAFFLAASPAVVFTCFLDAVRYPVLSASLLTALLLAPLVPNSTLGYLILRHNFLHIGVQRNLVYALSATFLALLYLTLVRRISEWFEDFFPPVATTSILLFLLVVFFEPIERWVGGVLRRAFRREAERLQRLTSEIQQVARGGELAQLVDFAESCIAEALGLAHVRIALHGGPARPAVSSGRVQRFVLRNGPAEIGVLEAFHYGASLSGETNATLAYLAEQLPAAVDLCRLLEEKVRLERDLAERERLAALGQMAASVSHNLKNPLSSMKTLLQVQLENPHLPEDVKRDCALAVAEIDRLSAKLAQLLQFARPAVRGSGAGPVAAADASAVAEQVVTLLRHDAERRGVSLELRDEAGGACVAASEQALGDVLTNLVVNAIEAAAAGGHVRVALEKREGQLLVHVTDDGPGIPAELRDRVFQPFFTTKPSGTGLGLAIVARRLEEIGGLVGCESPVADGRGTRFTVVLPIAG